MEKAFDKKALAEKLKGKGLPEIEGLVEIVAGEVFAWAEESCMIHENQWVKSIGVPAIQFIKPLAMAAIDKIDGQPG